jgi:hypothetical protein
MSTRQPGRHETKQSWEASRLPSPGCRQGRLPEGAPTQSSVAVHIARLMVERAMFSEPMPVRATRFG